MIAPFSQARAIAAFFAKTIPEPNTGCLLWTGNIQVSRGYGRFRRAYRAISAHRFAFMIAHGPIPSGMCVCHRCDTKLCVNVDHLFLGTQLDNVKDMCAKGRTHHGEYQKAKTHCPHGHEYTAENTRRSKGKRSCRACKRDYDRRRHAGALKLE